MNAPKTTTDDALASQIETLTPREIVAELDKFIIGQANAKRAVAVALRNRYRRARLSEEMRDEVIPKNILMIGPTGVGKTEIARRLAKLAKAPFLKVEATKFTEVGYVGRDVDSMVRDLVQTSVRLVENEQIESVQEEADRIAIEKIVETVRPRRARGSTASANGNGATESANGANGANAAGQTVPGAPITVSNLQQLAAEMQRQLGPLLGMGVGLSDPAVAGPSLGRPNLVENDAPQSEDEKQAQEREGRVRQQLKDQIASGGRDDEEIEIEVEELGAPSPFLGLFNGPGGEEMGQDLQGVLGQMIPKRRKRRRVTIKEARVILRTEAARGLVDYDAVTREAVRRAEQSGIIFIDELDKVAGRGGENGGSNIDVSRGGVQRDLLPIIEGSTVQTRQGMVRTNFMLFIAAGAFHVAKPSDLIPELQGRLPIRVELDSLNEDDFRRILTEPENALTKQYSALLATDGVTVTFTDDAISELARISVAVNSRTENIGARRLYTVMERLLDDLSFEAPNVEETTVVIDGAFVRRRLDEVAKDDDLSRYIL